MTSIYSTLRLSIPRRSIRVLDIQNDDDDSDDTPSVLHGNLRVVNLVDKPKFTALSYVWGRHHLPPYTIDVNGNSIPTTQNCWLALRRLTRNFGPLTIWVDSICINQEDEREKETQIALMKDIYSMATSVFVWLGEEDPEAESAMHYLSTAGFQQFLKERNDMYYQIPRDSWLPWRIGLNLATKNIRNFVVCWWNVGLLAGIGAYWYGRKTTPDSCILFDSLDSFFSRDWALRMWTLQEVVLAKDPIICCGNKTLSWRSMVHSISYLEHVVDQYNRLDFPESSFHVWKSMVLLWLHVNSDQQTNQGDQANSSTALASFLPEHLAFFEACTRRHRIIANAGFGANVVIQSFILLILSRSLRHWVYQIVGFGYAAMELALVAILLLDPVYQTSYYRSHFDSLLSSTIQEAIIHGISARRATDLRDKSFGIHALSSRLGIQLAPADYRVTQEDIHRELFVSLLRWTNSLGLILCSACSGENYESSWVPDFSENVTDGWFHPAYLFQKANYNATPSSPPVYAVREGNLILKGMFISSILELSPPFKEITEQVLDSRYANPLMLDQLSVLREYCFGHNPFLTKFEPQMLGDPDGPRRNLIPEMAVPNLYHWQHVMSPLAKYGRLLFKTSIPGRMSAGSCPNKSEIGDSIALASGVSLPLVLRKWGDGYRLIGLAEIDGVMKGELWNDMMEEDLIELVIK